MINVFIGTKAQFIKVAPVVRELISENIPFRLIDTCQHADITAPIRKLFRIREPDASIRSGYANINTIPRAMIWLLRIFWSMLFSRQAFRRKVFGDQKKGICIVHGDTLSTLLGLMIGKYYGFKVGHLEAGLRSFDIFDPFPEELIRLICMRCSDHLFTPSQWASDNLRDMEVKGAVHDVGANTILDSIKYILSSSPAEPTGPEPGYALMSIHRFENIYSRKRLKTIADLALEIADSRKVQFILHQPTLKKLSSFRLLGRLKSEHNITLAAITGYNRFIYLIKNSAFVVTDGGSIQEECYYLDRPCLLMREHTERLYGLGENVCLSGFREKRIRDFLKDHASYKREGRIPEQNPSARITRILKDMDQ